jgi:hypothetical protein
MNTTVKYLLAGTAILALVALFLRLGFSWGRWISPMGFNSGMMASQPWARGMMAGSWGDTQSSFCPNHPGETGFGRMPHMGSSLGMGPTMMNSAGFSMMGAYSGNSQDGTCPAFSPNGGLGMMAFPGMGMMSRPASNWMWDTAENVPALSIEENRDILQAYLAENGWEDRFMIADIMIFSNHAYAQLVEQDSGIGAYEVLIDQASATVYPEHGANMMWNTKYGMHPAQDDGPMPITETEAVNLAQSALEDGATLEDHGTTFYGYYTFHILEDGQVSGMLSVNGFSGAVLAHTWHGDLIAYDENTH